MIEYARPRGLDDPAIISAVGPGGSLPAGVRPVGRVCSLTEEYRGIF